MIVNVRHEDWREARRIAQEKLNGAFPHIKVVLFVKAPQQDPKKPVQYLPERDWIFSSVLSD